MELGFEYLLAALEVTRGTPVNPPTRHLNLAGTIKPGQDRYRPKEARGTLAEHYRSKVVRRRGEFEAEGAADVYTLPLLLNATVAPNAAPSTPVGATLTRLWPFAPTMTSDDLKSLTAYWGDPNVQALQMAYLMMDKFSIKGDAAGTDGVTMSFSGTGYFPTETNPSSVPAQLVAPLLVPGEMEIWLDIDDPIGTTSIGDRVLSAEFSADTGIARKYWARGPGSSLNFSGIGRGPRHAEMKLVFEVPDMVQYGQFSTDDVIKARVRWNGPEIEEGFHHYIQADIYGSWDGFDWGENENTNRTIEMSILSEYNLVAGHDFALAVQNDRATL